MPFMLLSSKVDDFQPLLCGIAHRIGRPAALPVEVADTYTAVVHQMSVALVHTALGVLLGRVYNLICLGFDALILRCLLWTPAPCLRQTGQDKNQLDTRIVWFQFQYRFGGESIYFM